MFVLTNIDIAGGWWD